MRTAVDSLSSLRLSLSRSLLLCLLNLSDSTEFNTDWRILNRVVTYRSSAFPEFQHWGASTRKLFICHDPNLLHFVAVFVFDNFNLSFSD
ncbi:hypothetical protein NC653_040549 [Populus alba x Populus x berolinensis]|uniref:Secreted protein n=1 Tax=Populus alba x Populus x berolinensis TaxID=444605 RepID=A0AAD6L6T1_9ROSI|nr:hypothetical protein NC653_040549 [Populus alba x Populus x berolinensis]